MKTLVIRTDYSHHVLRAARDQFTPLTLGQFTRLFLILNCGYKEV
jgi:hypothetical protein